MLEKLRTRGILELSIFKRNSKSVHGKTAEIEGIRRREEVLRLAQASRNLVVQDEKGNILACPYGDPTGIENEIGELLVSAKVPASRQ